jgi:thioredoxin 1
MSSILKAVTSENYEEEVLEAKGPVIVDFWAPWCAPCKQLTPRLEKFAAEHPNVKVVTVNCQDHKDFTISLGVAAIPSLMLYNNSERLIVAIGGQAVHHFDNVFSKAVEIAEKSDDKN